MAGLRYLLDTNIVSDLIRNPRGAARQRLEAVGADAVCTSIVVACELRYGARKRNAPRLGAQLETVLSVLPVIALDAGADDHYAQLRTELERAGTPIGPNDMLIAAHARALDLVLVTDNTAEFGRVPALRVENWLSR